MPSFLYVLAFHMVILLLNSSTVLFSWITGRKIFLLMISMLRTVAILGIVSSYDADCDHEMELELLIIMNLITMDVMAEIG